MSLISDVRTGLGNLSQSHRDMKKFGITMAIALTLLAILIFFFSTHPHRAFWLLGIGVIFLGLGFLLPALLMQMAFQHVNRRYGNASGSSAEASNI